MVIGMEEKKLFLQTWSNKRGWIKVVEAFMMILLITGIMLIIIDSGGIKIESFSDKIYEVEQSILKNIQLNNTLRQEVINTASLPVEWENFPSVLKSDIEGKVPAEVECQAKLCEPSGDCTLNATNEKNIYAQSTIIGADLDNYNPVKITLFCWER